MRRHIPRTSPPRRAAIALPATKPFERWLAVGILCALIGAACLAERLPLLPG